MNFWIKLIIVVTVWELTWGYVRSRRRISVYDEAKKRSEEIKKPLMVVGTPEPSPGQLMSGGYTYGCGDLCVDLKGCKCENSVAGDLLETLKALPDGSYVIFISCVIEYVRYNSKQLGELRHHLGRVSGDWDKNLFVCHIEPWTMTAIGYVTTNLEWVPSQRLMFSKDHWMNIRDDSTPE